MKKIVKEEPVKEEPVKEEPVKEEPVKEEPVKEEPVKEEPVKEEPVKEKPVKEEPVKEAKAFIEIPQPKKIKVDKSEVHFRGVFATDDIEKDELVERCPMVPLDHRMKYHTDSTIYKYLYTHTCPCEECKKHGGTFLMVLGYGMLYNHQDIPNTVWNFRYKDNIAEVIATKKIKKGEEIFVSYGEAYFRGKKKITLENNSVKINENENMPPEWRNWVKENLIRGVPTPKIKEILISHSFDEELINDVIGDNQ